ncbi:MAG: M56 family metallopeptidase [Pseudomonadota bacterium]|nr:M56 family metallopeptidase [Pseudomonadota bacterium]
MTALVPWAAEALIASSLLMLLVLALRSPVRRAFGPDIAYALWLLPALRLLLPPMPAAAWRDTVAAPLAHAGAQIVILVEPLGEVAAAPARHAPVSGQLLFPLLICLWGAGAAVFILWHAANHARFCRRMLAQREGDTLIERGVRVIETRAANGPLAFGVWRRYVAFPRDIAERYDADERDLALAHELGHHERGDLIANWVALVVLAVHWFNPVAWRAFRAFRADQEIANDARVLAGRDPVTRHLYACAIIKAAHGGAVSAACHLHTVEDLKGRLKMLTTNRTSRARLIGGSGALALMIAAGLGVTASGTQAAERIRSTVERTTGVKLDRLALPAFQVAPPALPALPPSAAMPDLATPTRGEHHHKLVVMDGDKAVAENAENNAGGIPAQADGGLQRTTHFIIRNHDDPVSSGNFAVKDMPDVDRMLRHMPQVASMRCTGVPGDKPVINDEKNGRKLILICTDRIERMARQGGAMAAHDANAERLA